MIHGVGEIIKTQLHIGLADNDTIQRRRDICRFCNESTKNSDIKYINTNGLTNRSQCRLCACFLVEKSKRLNETCPLGKWTI